MLSFKNRRLPDRREHVGGSRNSTFTKRKGKDNLKVIKVLAFFDTAQTGVPVAGTKIYDIPLTGNTLKASQPMEVLQILGQREGAKPSFGNLKPSGAIDSPVTGDLAPLVFMAIMGAPVSTTDFTTDVWTAATLYDGVIS